MTLEPSLKEQSPGTILDTNEEDWGGAFRLVNTMVFLAQALPRSYCHVCGPLACSLGPALTASNTIIPMPLKVIMPCSQEAVPNRGRAPFCGYKSLPPWAAGPVPQACQPYLVSSGHVQQPLRMTGVEFYSLP